GPVCNIAEDDAPAGRAAVFCITWDEKTSADRRECGRRGHKSLGWEGREALLDLGGLDQAQHRLVDGVGAARHRLLQFVHRRALLEPRPDRGRELDRLRVRPREVRSLLTEDAGGV